MEFLDKFGLCWYSGCVSVWMWVLFRAIGCNFCVVCLGFNIFII